VQSDARILKFAQQENSASFIEQKLQEEKPKFAALLLLKTFDWGKLMVGIHYYYQQINSKKLPEQELIKSVASVLLDRAKEQQQTADKFVKQLEIILQNQHINGDLLNERVTKAKQYFAKVIHDELILPIEKIKSFLNGKVKVKQFSRDTEELEALFWKKLNSLQRITFGDFTFDVPLIERKFIAGKASSTKTEKGNSKLITLEFYQKGLSVIEIAKQRGITTGTVENHLADFISTGQVNVFDFLSQRDLDEIQQAITLLDTTNLTPIKQKLGQALSYTQLKMGISYLAQSNL
jgi:DNA-binding NarL/FixJ family response regulator